jgi:succinate dehydrogenase/fumarate reductase cytochrome b subunit
MRSNQTTIPSTLKTLSGTCILFFLFIFINDNYISSRDNQIGALSELNTKEIDQVISIIIGMVGLIIAWKNELVGGIIALVGFLFLGYFNSNTIFSPFSIFTLNAIFFIWHWYAIKSKRKKLKRQKGR